ncbi:MAG: hypothetical protein WBE57_12255 [Xanthobacteraceae bacterium]
MTERGLVFEDFADKVNEVFVISQDGLPAIPLTLKEAELLNPAMAPPGLRPLFSLTFFARDPRIFPQSLYRLEHQELGAVTIFLVPSAKDAEGKQYRDPAASRSVPRCAPVRPVEVNGAKRITLNRSIA